MDVIEWVRREVAEGHLMLDQVMEGLTAEVAHHEAGGTTNTIAQLMAHVVVAQDFAMNIALRGAESVFDRGGWSVKTGLPPAPREYWTNGWRLDLTAFDAYRTAARESIEAYLSTLTPVDLEGDTTWFGTTRTRLYVLSRPGTSHVRFHAGEISTLKGLQGLKGLPY